MSWALYKQLVIPQGYGFKVVPLMQYSWNVSRRYRYRSAPVSTLKRVHYNNLPRSFTGGENEPQRHLAQ